MSETKTHVSPRQEAFIDSLLANRRLLVLLVILISLVALYYVPHIRVDVTLKSGIDTSTAAYKQHEQFLQVFGTEEFILVVIRNEQEAGTPAMLKALETITRQLEQSPRIVEVVSLANLRLFQEKKGKFGSFHVLDRDGDTLRLPPEAVLERLKKALPLMDLLVSVDRATLGIMVRIDDQFRYDTPVIEEILNEISSIINANVAPGSDVRFLGGPVIRRAIQHYNLQTAWTFGLLCLFIACLVSYYMFKSIRASVITVVVVALCVLWILGLMGLLGILLNSTTALAFGLVLIAAVEPVIHLVTHYNQEIEIVGNNRLLAAKRALLTGAGPCLTTSFTTSLGFSSLIVASFSAIRELGFVLALGPLFAFILAVTLTPAFLMVMKPMPPRSLAKISDDVAAHGFQRLRRFVFAHHRLCLGAILIVIFFMLAGTPRIHSDTQLLRLLTESTDEIKNLRFVERNLAVINTIEIVVEAGPNTFKQPEAWQKVKAMEDAISKIPEVAGVDSILPLFQYVHEMTGGGDAASQDLFTNPRAIPQLLGLLSFSEEGRRLVRKNIDEHFGIVRATVRIKNSPNVPIGTTIRDLQSAAASQIGDLGTVYATGDLVVFASMAEDIVESQASSLLLAVFYMSVLLTIQFRSISLGLVSLLPQLLPQSVIFGLMGWARISLDQVTVFSAAVSIGLTADNTVHYLTQLKRELQVSDATRPIEDTLAKAYEVTSRAMISNHAVIFFGFLVLLISPYNPVINVGILGAAAIFCSLVGDLIFIPSAVLSSRLIRRLMQREMVENRGFWRRRWFGGKDVTAWHGSAD